MNLKTFAFSFALFFALIGSTAQAAERWEQLPDPMLPPAAEKSGAAPVNGIEMYYAVYGKGPPVLLIHGGLGYADIWGGQVAEAPLWRGEVIGIRDKEIDTERRDCDHREEEESAPGCIQNPVYSSP